MTIMMTMMNMKIMTMRRTTDDESIDDEQMKKKSLELDQPTTFGGCHIHSKSVTHNTNHDALF